MTQSTQTQDVSLEIADIANATQIIKAAIERQTFQAEEMSSVAGVFDKFAAFMTQVEASAKAEKEAAEAAGEAEVEAIDTSAE